MTYEYTKAIVPPNHDEVTLAEFGKEGWEIISIIPGKAESQGFNDKGLLVAGPPVPMLIMYFKREVQPAANWEQGAISKEEIRELVEK